MAVGDFGKAAVQSYVAYDVETTYGTYAVSSTAIHTCQPNSVGFRTDIDSMKLDALTRNRGFTTRVQLNKNVGGALEMYLHADESLHFMVNALGGFYTFTSLTSAGDHSVSSSNFGATDTITSLSFNVQKGDQHSFRYVGGVINNMKISATIGEPAKLTCEFIFQDSSISTADTLTTLSLSSAAPFTYVNGVFRYAQTEALAATTTAAEPIQSFELEINNNMVTDDAARQLGSRLLSRRPPATRRDIKFKVTQRFDTTTAFNRFIQATASSVELYFVGDSISAEYNREMTIRLPNVKLNSPDVTLDGANDILESEIDFDVMVSGDPMTTTSRDIGITVRNSRTTKL